MPAGTVVLRVYEWPPLAAFLAASMGKSGLHTMADPLARVNVMAYRAGEALNWHFDRSEFTTTLLLQAPEAGGAFEYRTDLRTDADPNYEGVARLIEGRDPDVRIEPITAGTLNVFKGKNTAHRVTTVAGPRERIIAVFSYYERPGGHLHGRGATGLLRPGCVKARRNTCLKCGLLDQIGLRQLHQALAAEACIVAGMHDADGKLAQTAASSGCSAPR